MALENHIRKHVAKVLNINPNGPWTITDCNAEKSLYQVRHSPTADMKLWGNLRGIIVSLKSSLKLTLPYGHTPTCKTDKLSPFNNDLKLMDEDGNTFSYPTSEVSYTYGFEGIMLNVCKDDGEVIISSRKKIDVSTSIRDTSITFLQMYKQLGGPSESLFTKKYSPFCHRFIVVHPSLFRATKMEVGPGFLVYLGAVKTYDKHPYPPEEVETEPVVPETTNVLPDKITSPIIYCPQNLSLEEANRHLKDGWHPGSGMGEFIIVNTKDGQYRVAGKNYLFRWNKRGDAPNIYYRFYQLYDYTLFDPKNQSAVAQFRKKFINLDYVEPQKIKELVKEKDYKLFNWPETGIECNINNQMDRLTLIWFNMIYVSPLSRVPEVLEFLDRFVKDKEKLIQFIKAHPDETQLPHVPERMATIIKNLKESQDREGDIKRVLKGELGPSLYKMVNYVRKFKEP